jgi:ribosomal protein L37E
MDPKWWMRSSCGFPLRIKGRPILVFSDEEAEQERQKLRRKFHGKGGVETMVKSTEKSRFAGTLPRRLACPAREFLAQSVDFVFGTVFGVNQCVAGIREGFDDGAKFQVNRLRVLVLGALNQKNHKKCNDCGSCVDDQLPRV